MRARVSCHAASLTGAFLLLAGVGSGCRSEARFPPLGATPEPMVGVQPGWVSASVGQHRFDVAWEPVPAASGYVLYVSTDSRLAAAGWRTAPAIRTQPVSSPQPVAAAAGRTWYARVTAVVENEETEGLAVAAAPIATGWEGLVPSVEASATWAFEGPTTQQRTGAALGRIDANGDGFDDLIAGAPCPGCTGMPGRIHLFPGTPAGPAAAPITRLGPANGDEFGASVAGGFLDAGPNEDLVVGAPQWLNGAGGRGGIFVYRGTGDASVIEGTAGFTGETSLPESLGASVAVVGAIDADGREDVLTGAPAYDSGGDAGEGRVILYGTVGASGPLDPVPAWSYENNQTNSRMGASSTALGDFNGDDLPDFAFGAPGADPITDVGIVYYVRRLGGGGISIPGGVSGNEAFADFGAGLAGVGDVDADGFDDLVVGAPLRDALGTDAGGLFLFLGRSGGFQASAWAPAAAAGDLLGTAVGAAGDVNADGFADVIASAPGHGGGDGKVLLFLGGPLGLPDEPSLAVLGDPGMTDRLGSAVARLDANGDGSSDVAAGADQWGSNMGKVVLWYGPPARGSSIEGLSVIAATAGAPAPLAGVTIEDPAMDRRWICHADRGTGEGEEALGPCGPDLGTVTLTWTSAGTYSVTLRVETAGYGTEASASFAAVVSGN